MISAKKLLFIGTLLGAVASVQAANMRHAIETQDADTRILQEEEAEMSIPSFESQDTLSEEDEQFLLHHKGDVTVCKKDGTLETISISNIFLLYKVLLFKGGDICKSELDTCEEYKCFPGTYQGTCVKGNAMDGSPCDDGDLTTDDDKCDSSGVCTGSPPCTDEEPPVQGDLITMIPSLTPGTTVGGFVDSDSSIPLCVGVDQREPTKFFRVVGTGNMLTASTCNDGNDATGSADFDTLISVFTSCGFQCVDANDDGGGCKVGSLVQWQSVAGEEYTIIVGGLDPERRLALINNATAKDLSQRQLQVTGNFVLSVSE